MTGPDIPDEGGSDYGYDLAHDVPGAVRAPVSEAQQRQPARRRPEPSPLTGGDYGYDEAHGSH